MLLGYTSSERYLFYLFPGSSVLGTTLSSLKTLPHIQYLRMDFRSCLTSVPLCDLGRIGEKNGRTGTGSLSFRHLQWSFADESKSDRR